MTTLQRYRPAASTQLVLHILERPELVAAVRELPGPVLGQLIDHVGLEDASELVALASTDQLAQVFDQDLWRASAPGADERFHAARFALWLHVLGEAGEAFLVQRLCALPRDLLVLAVHQLVLVLDLDGWAHQFQAAGDDAAWTEKALETALYEEWEEFGLIARDPASWDVLWTALVALDQDHHALLRAVLEQCAALDADRIVEQSGLYAALTSEEMLEADVAADREDRRAAQGYVAPADARAFLALARSGEPALERDPLTRAYFRDLAPPELAPTAAAAAERDAARAADRPALADLLEAAGATEPARPEPRLRLGAGAGEVTGSLERALAELQTCAPEVYAERVAELGYLANVLIAGTTESERPRPVDALRTAARICSAGIARALAAEPVIADDGGLSPEARLVHRLPCDVLFRLGAR